MRSLTTILIIASVAYLAVSQVAPTASNTVTGCASYSGLTTLTLCTSCNTGFVLTNQSSSCGTQCPTGCLACLSSTTCLAGGCSKAGWAYNPNNMQCLDCTGAITPTPSVGNAVTLFTAGCNACTISTTASATINAVSCTGCASGYAYGSNTCYSCSSTSKTTTVGGTSTLAGIANCAVCTTASTSLQSGGTPAAAYTSGSNPYVLCTACAQNYALMPVLAVGTTSTTTAPGAAIVASSWLATTGTISAYVSTPVCYTTQTALSWVTTLPTASDAWGNLLWLGSATTTPGTVTNLLASCGQGTFFVTLSATTTAGSVALIWLMVCQGSNLAGYHTEVYQQSGGTLTTSATAAAIAPASANIATNSLPTGCTNINSASTCSYGWFIISLTTAPTWAAAGSTASTTGTVTNSTCLSCTSGTLVSGACIALSTGCTTMSAASTCSVAAAGYTLVSGTATLCSATTTSCTGGCGSGLYMLYNGSCVSGLTAITNCLVYNATGFCVQCGSQSTISGGVGYVTQVTNCTACSAGCSVCSSATNCTNCSTGYTITSTFTCASSASTTSKSSNMLLSGLAFISMIFYYIF